MNEQDLMNQINEQTKNIPIPDSISPENMKRMLDEYSKNEDTHEKKENDNITQINKTGKRNHIARRFATAACFVLCITGGIIAITASQRTLDTTMKDTDMMEAADSVAADEECADESATDDSSKDILTEQTLQSPSSYDAYYETLTKAFSEYYDSLATVTNEDTFYYEESAAGSLRGEAVARAATAESEQKTQNSMTDSVEDSSATKESADSEDFSKTNTQEEAIDEGDIIKTDGRYIYKMIQRYDETCGYYRSHLTITETDNGNLRFLSSIDLSALANGEKDLNLYVEEFYLHDNYIFIMYTNTDYTNELSTNQTCITIYDISDRENPKRLKTLTQSGHYESSRISDGYLYTISNFNEANLDTPKPYTNYIPCINGATIDCSDIYYPRDILLQSTHVVTSVKLSHPQDFTDAKAIPTNGGEVYVGDSSIYLYTTLYTDGTKTELIKIGYKDGVLTPGENAIISGYLYGSFALSEYKDHLRIVATIPANDASMLPRPVRSISEEDVTNAAKKELRVRADINVLYILDKNMKLTGKISGIAPGEKIYSARFMGDIGYFVTFRNMDPLFSVDLSNPENPKILGQLKIPGFSNYLHAYDDGLLLGLGEEYDPETMKFLGLKLSMFNTNDPSNVTEQDKYIIKNSIWAEAQYNHKALMIDPEKNTFGFLYEEQIEGTYSYNCYYVTYTYDKTEGFVETARYEISLDDREDTGMIRGIYIGDYLYIATNTSISSYPLGSNELFSKITLK
ncbi:MAG: hypothetical protein E7264_07810 [Lachnospiraceae bacterium]|nr:hypothetical protein [Lachnospiraceae bacterium]